MNNVQFSGRVASVNAYTDSSYKVLEDSCARWTFTDDYWSTTLVNSDSEDKDNWIKARFPKKIFNELFEKHAPETIKYLEISGELKTEIGFGSGYVRNYILVDKVSLLLT